MAASRTASAHEAYDSATRGIWGPGDLSVPFVVPMVSGVPVLWRDGTIRDQVFHPQVQRGQQTGVPDRVDAVRQFPFDEVGSGVLAALAEYGDDDVLWNVHHSLPELHGTRGGDADPRTGRR